MSDSRIRFNGRPVHVAGNKVKPGDKAPNFVLVDKDLKPVSLGQFRGKVVILSVFPSLDTPVCATQNRKFNEAATQLSDDIVILGISVDLPFAQARFCAAEGIDRVITLSDYMYREFGTKYGFLIDEYKLLARGVIVIDKEGIVRYVEYLPEVTDEPNYEAALEAAKKLV